MAPARLTVEGLTKAYGDLPVLDEVSFTVGRGEFVAVVVTAVLSVTLFALTFVLQRLVIPWHRRA